MSLREDETLSLKYSHPFTLAELQELDINLVSEEITRLQKSISLLKETNDTLRASLPVNAGQTLDTTTVIDPIAPDEVEEYLTIIKENDEVIEKQGERIFMCKYSLMKRLGFVPENKHYELDQNTTAIKAVDRPVEGDLGRGTSQATEQNDSTRNREPVESVANDGRVDNEREEQGLYL